MVVVGEGVVKGWVDNWAFREGIKTIDFSLIGNIALSWIVTIPFAFTLSAIIYAVARVPIIGPYYFMIILYILLIKNLSKGENRSGLYCAFLVLIHDAFLFSFFCKGILLHNEFFVDQ